MTTNTATEAQAKFLSRLIEERAGNAAAEAIATTARDAWRVGALSKKAASDFIEALLSIPANPTPEAEPGFYTRDGEAFKVQMNKASTHTYALVWSGTSWKYQPGAGRSLAGLVPMTAEEAARLGLASGRCIACSRDRKSTRLNSSH